MQFSRSTAAIINRRILLSARKFPGIHCHINLVNKTPQVIRKESAQAECRSIKRNGSDYLAAPLALDLMSNRNMSFSPETLRPRLSTGLPLQALMCKSTIAPGFYGYRAGTVKPAIRSANNVNILRVWLSGHIQLPVRGWS